MNRRAKIIATIGPATTHLEGIRALAEAGMNIARLNFSHGKHADHETAIDLLRQVSAERGRPIAIMLDLQGPKIRTGELAGNQPVLLKEGSEMVLTIRDVPSQEGLISIRYAHLIQDVNIEDRVLIDDGRIELEVLSKSDTDMRVRVLVGGSIKAHKGVNLPGVKLSIPPLTEKDLADLRFGIKLGVDIIAMSFVCTAADVLALRDQINNLCEHPLKPPIIAKLERPEAIQNLDAILAVSDGVMVARGDLGVEMRPEKVPSIQKQIIQAANLANKLVITATQMLDSMIQNPTPTRAEASDVANAVFDGSDALMLSGETAIGDYPVEAVKTMHRIICDAESHSQDWGHIEPPVSAPTDDDAEATTHAAWYLAQDRNVNAIAVFTRSGCTALYMSKARPQMSILAFTPEPATYQRMAIYWGVTSLLIPMADSVEEMSAILEDALIARGKFIAGEQVVLIASLPIGAMGPANLTLLHTIREKRGEKPWQ